MTIASRSAFGQTAVSRARTVGRGGGKLTARPDPGAYSLLSDVPLLVTTAREHPGVIHSGTIGGPIRVRVVCESDPAMLTVAISQRLLPGEMDHPDVVCALSGSAHNR
jgi:hypothetical protein